MRFEIGLAPMAGYTDRAFRKICLEFGADFAFTEMISAKGLLVACEKTKNLLPGPDERNVAVQIFGSDPDVLSTAAEELSKEFSWVDLNAGCPVRKVIRRGEGGALLRDLERLRYVVRAMRKRMNGRFSVKTRLGWDRNEIERIYAVLIEEGVNVIFVHARTVVQGFSGRADWKALSVLDKVVPTFMSGDIFSPEDARRALEESGCHGVIVARGAIGNPWIFKQIRDLLEKGGYEEPSPMQVYEVFVKHLELLIENKGEEKALKEMRKFVAGYTKKMRNAKKFREVFMKIENVDLLKEMVYNFFKEQEV